MKFLCLTLLTFIYINRNVAIIHYVPAQVLIPTFNLTAYNQTKPYYNRTGNWNGTTHDGNLILGQIGYLDRLLFNQEYFKPNRWYAGREKIIDYPKEVPGGYVRHETISAVRVYNRYYDGNSAKAVVLKGGLGQKFIRIRLESHRGKGFRYLVQIFGH